MQKLCVDRMVFCIAFWRVFTLFLQLVMVVAVSVDMSMVTVSVRITVNSASELKRRCTAQRTSGAPLSLLG